MHQVKDSRCHKNTNYIIKISVLILITMNEDEIRFRFLYGLYQKNNGEQTSERIDPHELTKMAGLEGIEESSLIREVTYLNKEGLIGGDFADGKILPAYVSTTNWGNETIEQIMSEMLSYLVQNDTGEVKDELEKIQGEESTSNQNLRLWEYIQREPKLKEIINEKAARLISDPGF